MFECVIFTGSTTGDSNMCNVKVDLMGEVSSRYVTITLAVICGVLSLVVVILVGCMLHDKRKYTGYKIVKASGVDNLHMTGVDNPYRGDVNGQGGAKTAMAGQDSRHVRL
jgi:hypothetical protein